MATAQGGAADHAERQHSDKLAGAGDGGSGSVCSLVVSGNLCLWLASVFTHQPGVKARLVGEETFDWIGRWAPTPGTQWKGRAECFVSKASRLMCTLLIHWEEGYEHAWAVLTDLAPEETAVSWYHMRTWVETGYKDIKRGQWGWHHSKMLSASRIERLWLAVLLMHLARTGGDAVAALRQTADRKSLGVAHVQQKEEHGDRFGDSS